jgi:hypothetical protein
LYEREKGVGVVVVVNVVGCARPRPLSCGVEAVFDVAIFIVWTRSCTADWN